MLLEIEGLDVRTREGTSLLSDVTLRLEAGEVLVVAGMSGAGKSLLTLALGDLLPDGLVASWRTRRLRGEAVPAGAMNSRRGRDIAWVFQDPRAAFHPCFRLGDQLDDAARISGSSWPEGRAERRSRLASALRRLGMDDAEGMLAALPDELSGGELQRASLAAALLHDPAVLILDEFTSQLDAPRRRDLLDLVVAEQARRGLGLILVTHDLGPALARADAVLVIDAGRVAEETRRPAELGAHPASRALLAARAFGDEDE